MNVLVIGSGGREHALAWKLGQSPKADTVFVAPGNAGTALEPGIENIAIDVLDTPQLIEFAQQNAIELTVVGPEAPLAAGIVDAFRAQGLACFGPSQAAAKLEASKAFAKDFMVANQIPTARSETFDDRSRAKAYLATQPLPIVIKADGLAAGKGVIIAQTSDEAIEAIDTLMPSNTPGEGRVVIEQFLQGEEASFIVMVDGEHILPFASSQDHKARDDGDKGPNTGGMGAYSPAPIVTSESHDAIMAKVITPTVRALVQSGTPYTGFLYAGLMIDDEGGINVLEFNCRMGDPETQVILPRLQSDLLEACHLACQGRLDQITLDWDDRACVGVVLAAAGYPGSYDKGLAISGLQTSFAPHQKAFHAGTRLDGDQILTSGGRVLCLTALGDTVTSAQQAAYALTQTIGWEGAYFRTDIGHRAILRERATIQD